MPMKDIENWSIVVDTCGCDAKEKKEKGGEQKMIMLATYLYKSKNAVSQKKNPKARAAKDAKNVGTKRVVASDEGPGAGASAAAAI